ALPHERLPLAVLLNDDGQGVLHALVGREAFATRVALPAAPGDGTPGGQAGVDHPAVHRFAIRALHGGSAGGLLGSGAIAARKVTTAEASAGEFGEDERGVRSAE